MSSIETNFRSPVKTYKTVCNDSDTVTLMSLWDPVKIYKTVCNDSHTMVSYDIRDL